MKPIRKTKPEANSIVIQNNNPNIYYCEVWWSDDGSIGTSMIPVIAWKITDNARRYDCINTLPILPNHQINRDSEYAILDTGIGSWVYAADDFITGRGNDCMWELLEDHIRTYDDMIIEDLDDYIDSMELDDSADHVFISDDDILELGDSYRMIYYTISAIRRSGRLIKTLRSGYNIKINRG